MKISSSAFGHNEMIPRKYSCQGQDISPELIIEDIPEGTKSLALIVDDPDAPMGTWVHWVVYNIPVDKNKIEEGAVPGKEAINNFGKKSYGGPCPPSGTHRYFFKIYALDGELDLQPEAEKKDLEKAMEGRILDKTELIGLYKKQ
ncbi:MAG: YbhB/YbcL family Raf kinase inhibitor-like protein [Candidatus Omnitrophota bacterium]